MKNQKSILVYGVEFFPNEVKERHCLQKKSLKARRVRRIYSQSCSYRTKTTLQNFVVHKFVEITGRCEVKQNIEKGAF